MSKKYESLAKAIVEKVGGNENIDSLHHCQTRLRFMLKDNNKADQDAINGMDGVAKVLINGGMFQVVIGMHVAEVYEEVVKLVPQNGGSMAPVESGEGNIENQEKKKLFDILADFVSSIFSPIVPALAGAGMVKALLALLVAFQLVDTSSQSYIIINMIGDATFAFMPILLAFSIGQKLKCNPFLAAVVAGIMCHATWGGLVAAKEPVLLFGMVPLYLVKYTGSVIPIVLVILVQAPIEKFLNKVVPKAVRLVFVPMITFLVMGILALSILGPLGDYVGNIMTLIFTWLSTNVSWIPPLFMGGLYPLLVIFGLHHGLAPLGTMQMAQMGYDAVFGPGVLCANIGQGTAALVVGILSKDSKTKQIGTSAGITGLMGITEPALYGVNVPKKYPLIAGLIGSACGGLFAGLTQTHRFATGSSGLPAVMMYLGDNTMRYFYQILIALAITIGVSAVATFILAMRFEGKNEK
ncbi:PTS beta-glucoside transporter subunit EIIBCA [Clostridium sp. MCC353]|uniref:PTS transporter subunit EIIC n=1 Tax=Clostridium sp. MCC353 TaxID=2592646 RepID=UPI001C00DA68|nr:PTS transporter subunit EIIC [Clostridium sp. MCC353]MBT9777357.1 PTS beta-glucoside transporter subunit EIIBCA [Clostridium sp. MCC353]